MNLVWATVNQGHPPVHHEGWMVSGQETVLNDSTKLAESAPDIVYGTVLSQNLPQISITVPFYLGRGMGPLSRVFAQSVVKRRATRSRPRSRHRRTHISYNVVLVLVTIGLLRDLFVAPFSPSFQFLLPTSAFCATRCRVQFGGAAFSFGAGMDERKRVKKPHPKK
jgi:hypothetical protein